MICFDSITFQNFLSVGNSPTTINLNDTKTTLVHGMNGSGKSTLLDVICYTLFNKPFRRVNLPLLINTQNKKGLLAEVVFRIGKDEFKVLRGQKPKIFKIFRNGEELDSKAADRDNQTFLEQNILKLTYKSFTQIVILGSSNFIPFMQLSSAGRRECVEDFLDIKVFSTMSVIAKERLRGLKDALHTLKGDIGNIEYKIDIQEQNIKTQEVRSQSDTDKVKAQMADTQLQIDKLNQLIASLSDRWTAQKEIVEGLERNQPREKTSTLRSVVTKLQTKIERNETNITFYKDHDTCHTCKQDIDASVKKKYVAASKREIKKYAKGIVEAQHQIIKYKDSIRVIDNNKEFITKLHQTVNGYVHEKEALEKILNHCRDTLQGVRDSVSNLDMDRGKLQVLQEDLASAQERRYQLMQSVEEHEFVNEMLKDSGIKTQIVKKYLPVMNKLIRKHLEEFDLPIYFNLDEEFNESVHSPLHQDFSYASFSEGQKSRIDLALMFTWREIGKLKNSVTTNLLVLDEVFSSSLDEDGKERLINFLRYKLDDAQRVVVVDHTLSGNFKEKFDRCIEVQRIRGFSKYT